MADNLPQPAVLVADRGYDSDNIREDIESRNALPMIPMRKNRRQFPRLRRYRLYQAVAPPFVNMT